MWLHRRNLLDNGCAFSNGSLCKVVDCAIDLMALDSKGNIFFIDDCHLRKMTPTREITTLTKELCNPQSITVSKGGIVFVVDQNKCLNTHTISIYDGITRETLAVHILSQMGVLDLDVKPTINWKEKPEVIMCTNDQLAIHLDDDTLLVSPINVTSIGCLSTVYTVQFKRFPTGFILKSFRKVCTNTNGNVFLLYGFDKRILKMESWGGWDEDAKYMPEMIATGVRYMTMDNSDNLYYNLLGGDRFVLNTSVKDQLPIHIHFLNTSVKDQLPIHIHYSCTSDLILDETGYYSKSNNTIEKFYFDNVYWKKGISFPSLILIIRITCKIGTIFTRTNRSSFDVTNEGSKQFENVQPHRQNPKRNIAYHLYAPLHYTIDGILHISKRIKKEFRDSSTIQQI